MLKSYKLDGRDVMGWTTERPSAKSTKGANNSANKDQA